MLDETPTEDVLPLAKLELRRYNKICLDFNWDGENMKVTKEDIQNVAGLSRRAIPDTETDVDIAQLGGFLEYVENLKEIDTEGVAPTTYALPMQNVFREDVVKPSLDREAALSNAPMKEDGYFKVPRVLEE